MSLAAQDDVLKIGRVRVHLDLVSLYTTEFTKRQPTAGSYDFCETSVHRT